MEVETKRPFYRRRRTWLVAWLLVVVLALGIAVLSANRSMIIIYNDTGLPLPSTTIAACGQTFLVPGIGVDDSIRLKLSPTGSESGVEVEIAHDPSVGFQGGFVAPRGGYRIELHVRPDYSIEFSSQISVWFRLF